MHQRGAISLLEQAEAAGDHRSAISGIGAATRVLEVIGRMLGDIPTSPTTINVTMSPQFIQVRQVLLGALERHPAARQDVLAALETIQ